MKKPMRFLICASAAALILGAAPTGAFVAPAQAQVAVEITAGIAPPPLPVYDQPPIPGPGYVWVPGYWAWNGYEYYWTPGYWAMPPAVGFYWTPPYWAFVDGDYDFYPGYWGPTVGFYGGVDYGFGYTGVGYQGGYWRNNQFVYNSAVNNLGAVAIAHTFSRAVSNPGARVAFNGGKGGTIARPTQAQIAARAHATPATAVQVRHQEMASRDPALRFNANHGRPPVAAMRRANEFHGAHTVAATHAPATAAAAAAAGAAAGAGAHALTAHPRVPEHAPARPRVAGHAPARPHFAYHAPARHAVVARPHFAYHAPARHAIAARPHFAYHAPARHAVVARPHFAHHAPAMRMGGAPHFGGMRMGAPHFGGMRMGGAPHFRGAPHGGGGPRGGGGARHIP